MLFMFAEWRLCDQESTPEKEPCQAKARPKAKEKLTTFNLFYQIYGFFEEHTKKETDWGTVNKNCFVPFHLIYTTVRSKAPASKKDYSNNLFC